MKRLSRWHATVCIIFSFITTWFLKDNFQPILNVVVDWLILLFHRNYIGYITCSQFRQCLASLHLEATPTEYAVMDRAFCDNRGFNYRKFLSELTPRETWDRMYDTRMARMELTKEVGGAHVWAWLGKCVFVAWRVWISQEEEVRNVVQYMLYFLE